mgnify:CR=1 FL=1
MLINDYKPMEPVTLITDLLLAVFGFLFAIFLLKYRKNVSQDKKVYGLMWVLSYLSIGLFALFGALAHGFTSITLQDIVWPPTMIFGGISFIFFAAGVIIYQKERDYRGLLMIPVALVVGYLIFGLLLGWPFLLWVILLLICSVIIFFFAFRAKKEEKMVAPYIIKGLTIIIISGIIQAIGGIIGYQTMFGPNNEFLFTPHNDIFHIIALIGLIVFFQGFKADLKT